MLTPLEHHCFPNVSCTSEDELRNIYSRIDGLCNNPKKPTQGGAGTDFLHLVAKREILFYFRQLAIVESLKDLNYRLTEYL